jgi:AcrR family transcriptional regulator
MTEDAAAAVNDNLDMVLQPDAPSSAPTYRRSARSPRGEARRRVLLDQVTDDIATNGLVEFSLRRAARAAGTTHKVLLYHFDGVDDLLTQAVRELRERRIARGLDAVAALESQQSLSARVRAMWPVLVGEDAWVHDQAIGLMMFDPQRYGELGKGATERYLEVLLSLCPGDWSARRKLGVSEMILGTLRGFLINRLASESGEDGTEAGLEALCRALDREEAAKD